MSALIKLPEDIIENTERKFGSETRYVYAKIEFEDGTEGDLMFTLNDIMIALNRGTTNPEDIPRDKSWWDTLFGG